MYRLLSQARTQPTSTVNVPSTHFAATWLASPRTLEPQSQGTSHAGHAFIASLSAHYAVDRPGGKPPVPLCPASVLVETRYKVGRDGPQRGHCLCTDCRPLILSSGALLTMVLSVSHLKAPSNPNVFACLSPISLGDLQQMDMPLSRLDCLFLAKVADQAERYNGAFPLTSSWRHV